MQSKGKLYVLVNKDLKMSIGKTAAQVAHAVARLNIAHPHTVIVLEGNSWQLQNLNTYLSEIKIHSLYIDEGANEVLPMSATALAFGLYELDEVPDYVAGFKLLKKKVWWKI